MSGICSHGSGTHIIRAWANERPLWRISSIALSRLSESLPDIETTGFNSSAGVPSASASSGDARLHPAAIALDRVDFAVVGDLAEWLGKTPGGEGVGAVALVEEGDRARHFRALEVDEERRQVFREAEALVDDGATGTRRDEEIGVGEASRGGGALDRAAAKHELALEGVEVGALRPADQDLGDVRQGREGGFAKHLGLHRHIAPGDDVEPALGQRGIDQGAGRRSAAPRHWGRKIIATP